MVVRPLEEELLRFELTGPKAHDVVRSVIQPSLSKMKDTDGRKADKEGTLSNEEVGPYFQLILLSSVCALSLFEGVGDLVPNEDARFPSFWHGDRPNCG